VHAIDRKNSRSMATPDLPAGVYGLEFSAAASSLNIHVKGPAIPGDELDINNL